MGWYQKVDIFDTALAVGFILVCAFFFPGIPIIIWVTSGCH